MKELTTRKHPRLKGYDYSNAGYYFITFCVKDGHSILWKNAHVGRAHPGVPQSSSNVPAIPLSEIGGIVRQHIDNIPKIYEYVDIDKYVIMPNHVHLIVVVKPGAPGCARPTKSVLSKVINALKSLTSRQFGKPIWQTSYHDRIIRNETEYQNTRISGDT